jgi:hypothetical protein
VDGVLGVCHTPRLLPREYGKPQYLEDGFIRRLHRRFQSFG